ncbi:MAG: AmmeMemoRadiSam system protein B [Acidobacteria bacterium]|nr:AmmeMemoRadiSam system protein B [Acidobacteriota bacterium]
MLPQVLPKLRADLDVMPSPSAEHPGLLLRDPFRYTETMLVIPPALVAALGWLDGERTRRELAHLLSHQLGENVPGELLSHLVGTLQSNGFLETEEYYRMRERRHTEFRNLAERPAAHAGAAYPNQPAALRAEFNKYFQSAPARSTGDGLIGIAAPHVSPLGGWQSYAAAYAQLPAEPDHRTYVVLGTSHYGQPGRFGMTRKPFVTPYGTLPVDTRLVDWIAARSGDAVVMEDYCHSIEHSIEFQCVFLQHVLGTRVRILPILCGSFIDSLLSGKPPESDPAVKRVLDTLAELAEREGSRLFWVLGVDLAHIGRRYGDSFEVQAGQGRMEKLRQRDRERLDAYCRGDAEAFFDLVRPKQDELRWCGYAPLYTFLKAVPAARGSLLHYEQWNIDEQSVVSCAAIRFTGDGIQATETQRHGE